MMVVAESQILEESFDPRSQTICSAGQSWQI